jgi:mono/diheme cytochrome c family protein
MIRGLVVSVVAGAAIAGAVLAAPAGSPAPASSDGTLLYDRYCLACHGAAGDGAGPGAAWLFPPPRDFTKGRFKWRTTASGKPPTDGDLTRAIREGAPGTSMPAFAGILDDAQIAQLVRAVKGFAPARFTIAPSVFVPPARPDAATLASPAFRERGKERFLSLGCTACHGPGGKGDGPAAPHLRDESGRPAVPRDLTTEPLHRGGGLDGIYLTLATGLDGTPMPAFPPAGKEGSDDLWAVAAFVESIRLQGTSPPRRLPALDPRREHPPVPPGIFPPVQGTPPASLPPAAASLSAQQCGRCHAKQFGEWKGSLHARADSAGLAAQLSRRTKGEAECRSCHSPLAEQLAAAGDLRSEGITCASCHVRGWTREGPPRRPDSGLLALPSYPLVEDRRFERSDFCLPCHQLSPTVVVKGRPLLDTYREWLEGPYMARGVQCQHCHMPSREHTWKGVHDKETVRQGLTVEAVRARDGAATVVTVRATNSGAGHYLPTTPTPAAWIKVELLGKDGKTVAVKQKRIGRHIEPGKDGWLEHEDTRIPPGETLVFAPRFTEAGERARVTVTFAPDDYYAGLYRKRLAGKLDAGQRLLYEKALRGAESSGFVVWEREL